MFDLAAEKPISLAEAAGLIPPARGGKKTHISTILRWILCGAKGPSGDKVYLEAQRVPRGWLTTREALQRFMEALTPRPGGGPKPAPRPPSAQRRASERAAGELEKLGI
jgi:hypothetical protein